MVLHLRHLTAFATTTDHTHPNGIPHHLDLSYITPQIMIASYPVEGWLYSKIRNNIDELVDYLEKAHGSNWHLYNFRGEKTLYDTSNERLQGRFDYIPLTDHIAPPFGLMLKIFKKFDDYIKQDENNIVVMHCKFGKGRSGILSVGYLVIYKGMQQTDAEKLFTVKRMKPGFGPGICITSQKRYVDYCTLYRDNGMFYQPFKTRLVGMRVTGLVGLDCVLKLQNFDESNKETLLGLIYDKRNSTNKLTSLVVAPYEQDLNIMDLRLIVYRPLVVANFLSYASIGFNIFWETHKKQMLDLIADDGVLSYTWDEFDGYLGSYKRGFRMFDKVEFFFERK